MSQAWLKFYPSDWRADPALRMCSLAARGLWMEMLCVMHEADPRGFLVVNGKALMSAQLAALAGCTSRETERLLGELEAAGVFSRDDTGTIFSRRILKDMARAERDALNGKRGGNPKLKAGVNPPHKAQKPEARIQRDSSDELSQRAKRAPPPDEAFDRFWSAYPKREGANPKDPARRKFVTWCAAGIDPETIIAGAEAYARAVASSDPRFVAQAMTWLNQCRWKDDHSPPAPRAQPSYSSHARETSLTRDAGYDREDSIPPDDFTGTTLDLAATDDGRGRPLV